VNTDKSIVTNAVLDIWDLDQTTLSDVRLVPPPGELDKTKHMCRLWFWPIPRLNYIKT